LSEKDRMIKKIKILETNLFISFCHETDKELEERYEAGVLMDYLRTLEKLKVEQSNDIK
tara:strand:+ start:245 stop:421 length:177 start_codon:yes stop_codon:yes gene_type:complete